METVANAMVAGPGDAAAMTKPAEAAARLVMSTLPSKNTQMQHAICVAAARAEPVVRSYHIVPAARAGHAAS